jgi:MFS family permease
MRRLVQRLRAADAAILSLTAASLAYSTMQMMIVPALPAIQRDIGATADEVAWLVSAYLASTAVSAPLAGRCGDLFGRRRVLIAVLAVFSCGGLLGVFAPSVEVLVVARILQGAAGAVFPLAYSLSREILPPERAPVAIGLIAGSFGLGGSLGLVLSGPLVDHVAWQATVGLGALLGLVAIAAVARYVPAGTRQRDVSLDPVGGLLLVVALVALLFGISGTAGSRVAFLAAGAAATAAWAAWELRHPMPLMDVRLLASRSIWPVNAAAAVVGFGMYATGFLVPLLAQSDPDATGVGFGASVTATSLFLLPATLSGLGTGAVAGMLGRRYGSLLPLAIGLVTMATGYAVMILGLHVAVAVAAATLISHGIGLNFSLAAMANLVTSAAPASRTGESSGMNTTIRTLGGALGIQIVAIVVVSAGETPDVVSTEGFSWAFGLCGLLMVAGLATLVRHRTAPVPAEAR